MSKVFANGEAKIEISLDGKATWLDLKDVTNFSPSMDGQVQEWTPYNEGGWIKRKMTSKSMSIAVEKKYDADEEVDKKLVEMAMTKNAYDHEASIRVTFPKMVAASAAAATLIVDAVISFSDIFTGESDDVPTIKFDAQVNGKPTYTVEA